MASHRTRLFVMVLGVLLVCLCIRGSSSGAQSAVRFVMPGDITWAPVSGYPPGYARAVLEGDVGKAGPVTYRVRLPEHFVFQPHRHTWDEHVTVLTGTWYLGVGTTFDASRLTAVPAGSFVIVPAGMPHFVSTEGEVIVQVHGTGPVGLEMIK